jgi:hypothetical protein
MAMTPNGIMEFRPQFHIRKVEFCYYTGHGISVTDFNGDEEDEKDEAYVFDDAFIIDDQLLTHLKQYKTSGSFKVVLLSDCCHSDCIWDLKEDSSLPQNLISISTAKDTNTSKQTFVDSKDQGIFTL